MRARALLVGINDYPGIGRLRGPENDVVAVEAWLLSLGGGALDRKRDITKITTKTCHPNGPLPLWTPAR